MRNKKLFCPYFPNATTTFLIVPHVVTHFPTSPTPPIITADSRPPSDREDTGRMPHIAYMAPERRKMSFPRTPFISTWDCEGQLRHDDWVSSLSPCNTGLLRRCFLRDRICTMLFAVLRCDTVGDVRLLVRRGSMVTYTARPISLRPYPLLIGNQRYHSGKVPIQNSAREAPRAQCY